MVLPRLFLESSYVNLETISTLYVAEIEGDVKMVDIHRVV